jgi:hypothetical protein
MHALSAFDLVIENLFDYDWRIRQAAAGGPDLTTC